MKHLTLPVVAVALFAVGDVAELNGLFEWGTKLGSFGFLAWFAWHMLTKTLPRMQEDQRVEVKELCEVFKDASETCAIISKENREMFILDGREARDHYRQVVDKLMTRQEQQQQDSGERLDKLMQQIKNSKE